MNAITREDLYSLEQYTHMRNAFRAKVMSHKKNRHLALGPNATLYFEDRLTMQYQIQEMLRVERIFEPAEIQGELDAYNPLVPDGDNWKATFMIEFADVEERKAALAKMIGIENKVWVQVNGQEPVWAIADEDLARDNEEKTSSVHFLRFQLPAGAVAAVLSGAAIAAGIDHPAYCHEVEVPQLVRDALAADLKTD